MKFSETKYGLYHIEKKKLLGYETTFNDGQDFCNEMQYSLSHYSDIPWYTDDPRIAEWVRVYNVHWYNSDYSCPMCDYKSTELKVVKLEIETTMTEVDINIPTVYEFYERRYAKSNPRHWESLKGIIDTVSPYNIYELDEIDYN